MVWGAGGFRLSRLLSSCLHNNTMVLSFTYLGHLAIIISGKKVEIEGTATSRAT